MVDPVNQPTPSPSPEKPADSMQQIQRTGRQQQSLESRQATEQQKAVSEGRKVADARESSEEMTERGEQVARKSREELEDIRDAVNDALKDMNIGLDFEEDDELEELVVKVMNRETEELIRKIPPEAMLEVAKRMEEMAGVFVDRWG